MRKQVSHGSADQMLAAFRNTLDNLDNGGTVQSSTSVEADDYIDLSYNERYVHSLIGDVDKELEKLNHFDNWSWATGEESLTLTTVKDEHVSEFDIPTADLVFDWDNMSNDVNYILDAVNQDVEASTKVQGAHGDDYFGQTEAKQYGDMIVEALAGKTVSKRKDLAEYPGGLIYEANALGIDMWDLLEALEGLCYEGICREIDDSTYKVLGNDSSVVNASEDTELEELTIEGFYQFFDPSISSTVMNNAARILYDYYSNYGHDYMPSYEDVMDVAYELDDEDNSHMVLMAIGEESEDEEYYLDDVDSCDEIHGSSEGVQDFTDERYVDNNGVFGEPGDEVSITELEKYWNEQYDFDPCLQEYDSYEAWLNATLEFMTPVNAEEEITDEGDGWENFEILRTKQVEDSDGFMTDYTMYKNLITGEYVFVFGDKDVYRPEDGDFDFETESEDEANEWFDNYNGFAEDDEDETY